MLFFFSHSSLALASSLSSPLNTWTTSELVTCEKLQLDMLTSWCFTSGINYHVNLYSEVIVDAFPSQTLLCLWRKHHMNCIDITFRSITDLTFWQIIDIFQLPDYHFKCSAGLVHTWSLFFWFSVELCFDLSETATKQNHHFFLHLELARPLFSASTFWYQGFMCGRLFKLFRLLLTHLQRFVLKPLWKGCWKLLPDLGSWEVFASCDYLTCIKGILNFKKKMYYLKKKRRRCDTFVINHKENICDALLHPQPFV